MQTQRTEGITYLTDPASTPIILSTLHPYVREWFTKTYQDFTPPQRFAIPSIHKRQHTLIVSPTGSGKTLSAFLAIINELVCLADAGNLDNRVYCIYVSPLKALGNDIERNLTKPLADIAAIANANGKTLDIRVAVRSGDTTAYEKQKMLKEVPHILITTPESLSIMLTSERFATLLYGCQWVIVDEIHSLAASKRGVHLSLSLERLAADGGEYTRIGLSATVAPLEDFALYLAGYADTGKSRGCAIADVTYAKQFDLQVVSPVPNLITASYHVMQERTYEVIHDLVQQHKTTLIFTNTRSATERVVHSLKDRFHGSYVTIEEHERQKEQPETQQTVRSVIAAHHGSLSKDHRLRVEEQLKAGQLRVVVSSTSLELGIDIGSIDLVILLGSPKSVSRALQRIGRAGHSLSQISKGRIIVLDRDDLVECAVLLRAAVKKHVDRLSIPRNCLDVLAQTIYGMAITRQQPKREMLRIIRRSSCYHALSDADFDATIKYLAGEYTELAERNTYAKIWYDKDTGMIGRKGKLARLLFMTNTGTIPDETNVIVKIGEAVIGTIAEPFLERLKRGDVFVLGGDVYEFQFSRGMVAQVKASAGRLPTVPSWYSEMLPLNYDLAQEIGLFRKYLAELLDAGKSKADIITYIKEYVLVDDNAAASIYEYVHEQHAFSVVPHKTRLVIEQFKDGAKHYAIFHTLCGRRVNDALSRLVGYVLGKLYRTDVEIGITDNGFFVMARQSILARRALSLLKANDVQTVLEHSLASSEVLRRRFRHCAARSLMILRTYKGTRKSVGKQQVSSQTLLAAVRRLGNDFPIIKEARREIMEDFMDAPHAAEILTAIDDGTISVVEKHLTIPSPFSFTIVLQGYSDILKVEDRQAFLLRMHQHVLNQIAGNASREPIAAALDESSSFSYDEHWQQEEDAKTITEEDKKLTLKSQLYRAARIERLEPDIVFEASRLIEGERTGFSDKFIAYLQGVLSGTVPKAYEDDLVRFFTEQLPTVKS